MTKIGSSQRFLGAGVLREKPNTASLNLILTGQLRWCGLCRDPRLERRETWGTPAPGYFGAELRSAWTDEGVCPYVQYNKGALKAGPLPHPPSPHQKRRRRQVNPGFGCAVRLHVILIDRCERAIKGSRIPIKFPECVDAICRT